MNPATPRPARAREHPEPPLATLEAALACAVLAAALVSCWLLYGPLILKMIGVLGDTFKAVFPPGANGKI